MTKVRIIDPDDEYYNTTHLASPCPVNPFTHIDVFFRNNWSKTYRTEQIEVVKQ